MGLRHEGGRRPARRAFRPMHDGTPELESRLLLSQASEVRIQTAANGRAVVVTAANNQQFYISVAQGGTIKATPASGGRVNLIVYGSTVDTELEINQIIPYRPFGHVAHQYNPSNIITGGTINIDAIDVVDGAIGAIEGYRDAVLSGPITATGTNTINRIAFETIKPGASIVTGGTLDTLDVLTYANFSGAGTGLSIGQDLNWAEVGNDLTFTDGANMTVGRDIGLVPQAAKGSGNAGQGLFVSGNLTVGTDDSIAVGRNVPFGVVVQGNLSGYSRITVGGQSLPQFFVSHGFVNFMVSGTATP